MLDRISAESTTPRSREQDSYAIIFTLLPDPRRQHDHSGFGQWSTSFLAPLPFTSNMRSLTEADVLSSNRGDLGEAEACLNNSEEERVIAATQPCISVWNRQECIDLRPSEETHKWTGQRLLPEPGELLQSGVLVVRKPVWAKQLSEDAFGLPDRVAGHRRECLHAHWRA